MRGPGNVSASRSPRVLSVPPLLPSTTGMAIRGSSGVSTSDLLQSSEKKRVQFPLLWRCQRLVSHFLGEIFRNYTRIIGTFLQNNWEKKVKNFLTPPIASQLELQPLYHHSPHCHLSLLILLLNITSPVAT